MVEQYGKKAAAIGCVIIIDQLMLALQRQNLVEEDIRQTIIMLYLPRERMHAIKMADIWRKNEIAVQLMRKSSRRSLEDYLAYGRRMGAGYVVYVEKDTQVTVISPADNNHQDMPSDKAMELVKQKNA